MITIKSKGDFKKVQRFLKKSKKISGFKNVELFAKLCVERLREVTPVDSGLTAESWEYEIDKKKGSKSLTIKNTNIQNGANVAILIEYGHATSSGAWVEGREFIEPAIIRTFNDIIDKTWKEIKSL